MRKRPVETGRSEWQPDTRTARLLAWTIAGQPENGPLPEGAMQILMAQRQADLFRAWQIVQAYGVPGAEFLRLDYGLPEVLRTKPDGIVTQLDDHFLADGIAEMLLKESEWAKREWITREQLHEYLMNRARKILWKHMRAQDRSNRKIMAAVVATNRYQGNTCTELVLDISKAFAPVERSMPELEKYCKALAGAADNETAVVDRSRVAKIYGIPLGRIDGWMHMMERKWQLELGLLRLKVGLYVKRRPVRVDRESGRFEVLPDEAA